MYHTQYKLTMSKDGRPYNSIVVDNGEEQCTNINSMPNTQKNPAMHRDIERKPKFKDIQVLLKMSSQYLGHEPF